MPRSMIGECGRCKFKERVPGTHHIKCTNPDPKMTGREHGIIKGWFNYPELFDPVWKTRLCDNFESVDRPGVDNVF